MTFVAALQPAEIEALRRALDGRAFEFKTVAHAAFSAKGEGVSCTAYNSGKCVVQGKGTAQFVAAYLPDHDMPDAEEAATDALLEFDHTVVGSDETGKGDYFGPLVTAAVAFGPGDAELLEEIRIADSKKLTPAIIRRAAPVIRESLPHAVVVVGPRRYNELYEKFRNLNALLAWTHATAVEEVLEKTDAKTVIVDRFCEESFLRRYLKPRALASNLVVRPRAESNHAVAAASISWSR